jgi:hypothetical protein
MKNIIRDVIPDLGYEIFHPDAGSGSRVKKTSGSGSATLLK